VTAVRECRDDSESKRFSRRVRLLWLTGPGHPRGERLESMAVYEASHSDGDNLRAAEIAKALGDSNVQLNHHVDRE